MIKILERSQKWSREDIWLLALRPALEYEKDANKYTKVLERRLGQKFQSEGPDSAQNQATGFFFFFFFSLK